MVVTGRSAVIALLLLLINGEISLCTTIRSVGPASMKIQPDKPHFPISPRAANGRFLSSDSPAEKTSEHGMPTNILPNASTADTRANTLQGGMNPMQARLRRRILLNLLLWTTDILPPSNL
jgi:hypothetical protein